VYIKIVLNQHIKVLNFIIRIKNYLHEEVGFVGLEPGTHYPNQTAHEFDRVGFDQFWRDYIKWVGWV